MWKIGDRVKVDTNSMTLVGRLGTVLRNTPSGYVEVELDSMYLAGVGLVAFRPEQLIATKKSRRDRNNLLTALVE